MGVTVSHSQVSWALHELVHLKHLDWCLTHIKHSIHDNDCSDYYGPWPFEGIIWPTSPCISPYQGCKLWKGVDYTLKLNDLPSWKASCSPFGLWLTQAQMPRRTYSLPGRWWDERQTTDIEGKNGSDLATHSHTCSDHPAPDFQEFLLLPSPLEELQGLQNLRDQSHTFSCSSPR